MTTRQKVLYKLKQFGDKEKEKLRQYTYLIKDGLVQHKELRKAGFVKLKGKWCDVYIHSTKNVVIKYPSTLIYTRTPQLAVPTIRVGRWLIQPLIRGGRTNAFDLLKDYTAKSVGEDLGHNHNCGYWRGVPVVYDW